MFINLLTTSFQKKCDFTCFLLFLNVLMSIKSKVISLKVEKFFWQMQQMWKIIKVFMWKSYSPSLLVSTQVSSQFIINHIRGTMNISVKESSLSHTSHSFTRYNKMQLLSWSCLQHTAMKTKKVFSFSNWFWLDMVMDMNREPLAILDIHWQLNHDHLCKAAPSASS